MGYVRGSWGGGGWYPMEKEERRKNHRKFVSGLSIFKN